MLAQRRLPTLCLLDVVLVQLACAGVSSSAPPTGAPAAAAPGTTLAPRTTEAPGSTEAPPAETPLPTVHSHYLTELFISPSGDDANDGTTRDRPLQTIGEAWRHIPEGELTRTGYALSLLPGTYPCEGNCNSYFDHRTGTETVPIVLQAADGPGTVPLLGGLNLAQVRYLQVRDLTLRADGADPMWGNNVLHLENGEFVSLTSLTVDELRRGSYRGRLLELVKTVHKG